MIAQRNKITFCDSKNNLHDFSNGKFQEKIIFLLSSLNLLENCVQHWVQKYLRSENWFSQFSCKVMFVRAQIYKLKFPWLNQAPMIFTNELNGKPRPVPKKTFNNFTWKTKSKFSVNVLNMILSIKKCSFHNQLEFTSVKISQASRNSSRYENKNTTFHKIQEKY